MKIKIEDNEDKNCKKHFIWKNNSKCESIYHIIRNIIKEEFKIHKSNIKELTSSNVNKTNERLDELSAETDLSASLDFTIQKITRK